MTRTVTGSARVRVAASAEAVWKAMKQYGNLDWAQGIAEVKLSGEGIGMIRSVRLEGSDEWLDERLIAVDEATRRFEYGIEAGMAGIGNYRASGQAIADGDGCVIQWQCGGRVEDDKADGMKSMLNGLAAGIAGLFAAQFD